MHRSSPFPTPLLIPNVAPTRNGYGDASQACYVLSASH